LSKEAFFLTLDDALFRPSRPNALAAGAHGGGASGGGANGGGGATKRSRNLAVPARVVGVLPDGRCVVRFTNDAGSDLSAAGGSAGRADGWARGAGDVRARVEVLRTIDNSDPPNQVRFEDRMQGMGFSVGDAVQLTGPAALPAIHSA